jgi:hypothetical protein
VLGKNRLSVFNRQRLCWRFLLLKGGKMEALDVACKNTSPGYALLWRKLFTINTCKTVTKQTTLTPFRMNTYEKQGEGGAPKPGQSGHE